MQLAEVLSLVRPEIRDLKAYSVKVEPDVTRLHMNESTRDIPAAVREEFINRVRDLLLNRYPEISAAPVREVLADYAGVRSEQIQVGNGSNEAIVAVLETFGGARSKLVFPWPGFSVYPLHARIANMLPVMVPLREDFSLDIPRLKEVVQIEQPKVVMIDNPNNPAGQLTPIKDLADFVRTCPSLVIVDEAYGEYAEESILPYLAELPNLVVMRTLSKTFSLAGARVGYCVSHESTAHEIGKIRLPYNVNAISQAAVQVCLAHRAEFVTMVEDVIAERRRITEKVNTLPGISAIPSRTNFILMRPKVLGPQQLFETMLNAGLLIRDFTGDPVVGDYVRISVGTREENDRVLAVLEQVCG